jgi:ElaA protein
MSDLNRANTPETPINRASSNSALVIEWTFSHFNELSAAQWYEISAARECVFIVEQRCPFLDADGADLNCWHLVGKVEQEIAAYCRIVPPGLKYTEPSIGRVITTPLYRTGGYGKALLTEALRHCDAMFPNLGNKIGAQMYLEKFYAAFGYKTTSAPYDEDGILHLEMVRGVSSTPIC